MKRIGIPIGIIVLLAVGGTGGWYAWMNLREWNADRKFSPPPEWSGDMQVVADGNNRFALDLYAKLVENEKGNVFFSPYSVHSALAMTSTGARGNTRDEMFRDLYLPDERDLLGDEPEA